MMGRRLGACDNGWVELPPIYVGVITVDYTVQDVRLRHILI